MGNMKISRYVIYKRQNYVWYDTLTNVILSFINRFRLANNLYPQYY